MSTPLTMSMTSGVFVECINADGHLLGQAVFTDWQGRPLPGLGDSMTVMVKSASTGRRQKIRGRVRARHFEVQHEGEQPSVWVRVEIIVGEPPRPKRVPRSRDMFSVN